MYSIRRFFRIKSTVVRIGCVALAAIAVLSIVPSMSLAACPVGDPTVLYCDDFSGGNPLTRYIVINPDSGTYPYDDISITNEALLLRTVKAPRPSARVMYNTPLDYKATLFEADILYTDDGAMKLEWTTLARDTVISFGLHNQSGVATASFFVYTPPLKPVGYAIGSLLKKPNITYRLALKINEVPGIIRPTVLAFEGYLDGTSLFAVTEDSLGVDLSGLPSQLYPSFLGSSAVYYSVDQVFDNAIVTIQGQRLTCTGFDPPLSSGPVSIKKNRALPFKAEITDVHGVPVTDLGSVPPVVQVTYAPLSGASVDVTDLAVPVGLRNEGNQFVYAGGKWQFNMDTTPYSAAGTYTVRMSAGNNYIISPTCIGSFVVN